MDEKNETNLVLKGVKDLGMAAYLKLHGFDLYMKQGRTFLFQIKPTQSEEFERTKVEYINGPFHKFDSEIMALKSLS